MVSFSGCHLCLGQRLTLWVEIILRCTLEEWCFCAVISDLWLSKNLFLSLLLQLLLFENWICEQKKRKEKKILCCWNHQPVADKAAPLSTFLKAIRVVCTFGGKNQWEADECQLFYIPLVKFCSKTVCQKKKIHTYLHIYASRIVNRIH